MPTQRDGVRIDHLADAVARAIGDFGRAVSPRFAPNIAGEPEEKIRGPFEGFLSSVGQVLGPSVVLGGEARDSALGVRSDYAVYGDGVLVGHVELKAPGKGADPTRYRGHDRRQWERNKNLFNVLYTDGNAWALYRLGELQREIVTLRGDVRSSGADLAPMDEGLARLIADFILWEPKAPQSLAELVHSLAALCRMLRDEVVEVLAREAAFQEGQARPFSEVAAEWRALLFPTANDERFADSYAQTVTFALLLARSEGVDVANIAMAAAELGRQHSLLGRALEVLVDENAPAEVAESVSVLQRVISVVDWRVMQQQERLFFSGFESIIGQADNVWLYFYESFLEQYDPVLREEAGAYYTPPAVVAAQTRLVVDLLRSNLNKPLGFAADGVVLLDPAMGSGSYLLRAVDEAARTVTQREGEGAVRGRLQSMVGRLIGFELMTGPFAVSELQLTAALKRYGVRVPPTGLRLFLADTLADPYEEERHLGNFYEPIARSRRGANEIKKNEQVLVCMGNPPYDRHEPGSGIGGWVRYGTPNTDAVPILDDFKGSGIRPGHLTSLYNLYVYFWRWALWKVFEAHGDEAPGIVAFITSSSFLSGPGFTKMREHLRRTVDEIWVIDLGGDSRGTRRANNVFASVGVPVAITICVRRGSADRESPAHVLYSQVLGTRRDKLEVLAGVKTVDDLQWDVAPTGWGDPLVPGGDEDWERLPELLDVFPWRSAGVKLKRTWPVSPSQQVLGSRWEALDTPDLARRAELFKEDVHRRLSSIARPLPGFDEPTPPRLDGQTIGPAPRIVPYSYRSFDRQWMFADSRLMGQPTMSLWEAHSDQQVHLVTLHAVPLEGGPGVVFTHLIPDLNFFRGNSTGAVLPLWRDAGASLPNVAPGLLEHLRALYGRNVSAEELFAYVAGVMAHSGYTSKYSEDLGRPGPRVPITKDAELFSRAVELGTKIISLHTFGERFSGVPRVDGRARMTQAVSTNENEIPSSVSYDQETQTLQIGSGAIAPISPSVWNYDVSGMKVLQHWLNYRRREPRGRRSSPLDDLAEDCWRPEWTSELLEIIWALEVLTDSEPELAELLESIAGSEVVTCDELEQAGILPVPAESRTGGGGARRRQPSAQTSLLDPN